jgi:hypothetical protein
MNANGMHNCSRRCSTGPVIPALQMPMNALQRSPVVQGIRILVLRVPAKKAKARFMPHCTKGSALWNLPLRKLPLEYRISKLPCMTTEHHCMQYRYVLNGFSEGMCRVDGLCPLSCIHQWQSKCKEVDVNKQRTSAATVQVVVLVLMSDLCTGSSAWLG